MKKYVPTTLDQYVNESNSITLRRGYGEKKPVVVGANAPIRNQVLAYVAEGQRVSSSDLKRFVAGLNETNANPNAAATMWLRRNGKFFISESNNGRTFYKLSTLGQRLVNRFAEPAGINEESKQLKDFKKNRKKKLALIVNDKDGNKIAKDITVSDEDLKKGFIMIDSYDKDGKKTKKKTNITASMLESNFKKDENGFRSWINEMEKKHNDFHQELGEIKGKDKYKNQLDAAMERFGMNETEVFGYERPNLSETEKFDFKDPKTGEPGLNDEEDEKPKKKVKKTEESCAKNEGLSNERRSRIESIINRIKSVNEAEEADIEMEDISGDDEGGEADELSFDDLDLSGEGGEKEEGEESEESEGEELDLEGGEEEGEEVDSDDKVEITEFILNVDDVDAAIEELEELGVTASKVLAEGFINEADEAEEGEDLEAEGEEKEAEGEEEEVEGEEEEVEGEEEEGKYKDDEISVPADQWDELKGWLESKGVDVEEMFGGEIEVEDEVEGDDMDLDLGDDEGGEEGEEGEEISDENMEMDLDLGDEGGDDIEGEVDDVEESLTGMENHEKDTNNLIKGAKQVVINYK